MADGYRIRPARPADARALSALEQTIFSDPWSAAGFRDILSASIGFGLVAERSSSLIGYLLGRLVAGEGEILNLAVVPAWRRRGVASALLQAGLEYFGRHGVEQVFLEVRESNERAKALYLSRGFRAVGQRSAYYRNPPEDALVLRLALPGPG